MLQVQCNRQGVSDQIKLLTSINVTMTDIPMPMTELPRWANMLTLGRSMCKNHLLSVTELVVHSNLSLHVLPNASKTDVCGWERLNYMQEWQGLSTQTEGIVVTSPKEILFRICNGVWREWFTQEWTVNGSFHTHTVHNMMTCSYYKFLPTVRSTLPYIHNVNLMTQ